VLGHLDAAAGVIEIHGYAWRMARRLGVMGGTFDPIHQGHLVAASEVAAAFELSEVVFVPTGQPWQKSHREVSSAEDRYLMTVIATAGDPRFTVSRVDVDRPGVTYTKDTLVDLRAERGEDVEFYFITGSDALAQILSWHDAQSLLGMAHFVGVSRPGYDPTLPEGLRDATVSLLEIPALAISSTDCRTRIRAGRPVRYLVPESVVSYIDKRELYR